MCRKNRQGKGRAAFFRQNAPLAAEIVSAGDAADAEGATWITAPYDRVMPQTNGILCVGKITSAHGTILHFSDHYAPQKDEDSFLLTRVVTVTACGTGDIGFSTRFGMHSDVPMDTSDADFFVPGIWYKNNAHVPPAALAARQTDRFFFFREDRLPLPVTALRRKETGLTVSLYHVGGVPTTFAGETGRKRIINARMGFGSLGFINEGFLETAFLMPGTEGERTYLPRSRPNDDGWARRSHPIVLAFTHRYTLRFQMHTTPDFPDAVQKTWRTAVALARPPVIKADLNKVYHASGELLNVVCRKYHGVLSVPFQVKVPGGEVIDTSSQMGFVGQALPGAALLLRWGTETKNADAVNRATGLVTFWVENGISAAGVPRNWYNISPTGKVEWRAYPTYLRIASDGAGGILQAWNFLRRAAYQPMPQWLLFCRRYGGWLGKVQNPDGSFFRAYDLNGDVRDKSLDTTSHPIVFLCDLFCATGDTHYRETAVRAGQYCWESVHNAYAYVGGTPDNPNVCDKEAGMTALSAFLALHDVTGEKRWLHAAMQAAWFCETWVYQWNLPVPFDAAAEMAFPRHGRTTHGLSLIATGHSGADNYMASAPFLYYRLSLLSGEPYFRDMAHRLMHNTKQMMNWDNTLGYRYRGLLTEAVNMVSPRGKGVMGWLPWLTVALLDPMVRLRDVFGAFDIAAIEERLPRAERHKRNQAFAQHRGFS